MSEPLVRLILITCTLYMYHISSTLHLYIIEHAGMLSGKYEDDFEGTLTAESADPTATGTSTTGGVADGGGEVDGPNEEEEEEGDGESGSEPSEEDNDTLTVSFDDISTLRRSLERDEVIRESLQASELERSNTSSHVSCRCCYCMACW